MAAEAEAAREARAKVVAAEGEQKASLHLKDAALVLEQSNSALQLRYLQVKFKIKVSLDLTFKTSDTERHLIRTKFYDSFPFSNWHVVSGYGEIERWKKEKRLDFL